MIFKLGLCYSREWLIYTKEVMQGGICSGMRLGGQGRELDYNEDLPVRRYRDGDIISVFPEFPLLVPFIVLLPLSVSALAY